MPDLLMPALESYRAGFTPSAQLAEPYSMAGVNVYAADTDAEARRLMTSAQQSITNRFRGRAGRLPPPIDDIDSYWNPAEKAEVSARMSCSVVGSPAAIRDGVRRFIEQTQVDEIMVVSAIYDHAARLRCYEIVAEALIAAR
jgi:alkanesulfonate monooxygenase SsuD/methylene tetrahydromethanopterin reductase-like flavin-dependent oxidoreductase (luciferase family)